MEKRPTITKSTQWPVREVLGHLAPVGKRPTTTKSTTNGTTTQKNSTYGNNSDMNNFTTPNVFASGHLIFCKSASKKT